jgi:hypothetical protein
MRIMRNAVCLLLFGAFCVSHGTALRAQDGNVIFCDTPSAQQDGVICLYTQPCYWDATPNTPWGDTTAASWFSDFCDLDYVPNGLIETDIIEACNYIGYMAGDDFPTVWDVTPRYDSPYWVYPPEEPGMMCWDGSFTCSYSLEQTCPS